MEVMHLIRSVALIILACSNCCGQLSIRSPFYVAQQLKATASAVSFPSGATHYWAFEEAAGASRSDSVGSVTLSEQAGTVVRTNGINGFGAYFSDNGRFLTNLTGVSLPRDFTVAAWFRMNVQPGIGTDYYQFDSRNEPSGFLLGSVAVDNDNAIILGGEEGVFYNEAGAYSLNTWHLIVGKWITDDSMWVSVDGGAFAEGATIGWPSDTAGYISVGESSGTSGGVTIDELCIWPRALTITEVGNIWNGGTGTFGP